MIKKSKKKHNFNNIISMFCGECGNLFSKKDLEFDKKTKEYYCKKCQKRR